MTLIHRYEVTFWIGRSAKIRRTVFALDPMDARARAQRELVQNFPQWDGFTFEFIDTEEL